MRGQKIGEIKEYLLNLATKSPKKIIDAYNDDLIGIKLVVLNALDKDIIDYDGGIYTYNGMTLGMSRDAIVDYVSLSKNKQILELIQRDLETHGFKPVKKVPEPVEQTVEESSTLMVNNERPRGGD